MNHRRELLLAFSHPARLLVVCPPDQQLRWITPAWVSEALRFALTASPDESVEELLTDVGQEQTKRNPGELLIAPDVLLELADALLPPQFDLVRRRRGDRHGRWTTT